MLRLAPGMWAQSLDQLRKCGGGRDECVVIWTGPAADASRIDAVEHPPHSATIGHYELDPTWLHQFWVELGRARRSVRAQVHTHLGPAFHSGTDDTYPIIHVPGFLSLVLPDGAMGALDGSTLWLAEIDERGRWRRVPVDERIVRA